MNDKISTNEVVAIVLAKMHGCFSCPDIDKCVKNSVIKYSAECVAKMTNQIFTKDDINSRLREKR